MEQHNHYTANPSRYDQPNIYNRCGRSGVLLPKVSLGMWHNFSSGDPFERSRAITRYAFDHGITHFDLANNYGPPPGTAEETLIPETAGTEDDAAAESGEMTEETNDPSDEAGSEPEPQEP